MTGGTPYGRPLSGTAADRDGLQLDQLPVRLGPFFPVFPPGLVLDVKLQGDVLQEITVGEIPFRDRGAPGRSSGQADPFRAALDGPTPIRELELARARHHLRWFAEALRQSGLGALGRRVLRLAIQVHAGDADEVRRMASVLERLHALAPATAGVGRLTEAALGHAVTGPVARASGRLEDARLGDPAYRALGFVPITQREGDARARWRQRLAESVQSLELAERAGERHTEEHGTVESPWGRLMADRSPGLPLMDLLPRFLAGQEWGDAMTSLVSLDLDLDFEFELTRAHRPAEAAA
jgi:hypothetical protein